MALMPSLQTFLGIFIIWLFKRPISFKLGSCNNSCPTYERWFPLKLIFSSFNSFSTPLGRFCNMFLDRSRDFSPEGQDMVNEVSSSRHATAARLRICGKHRHSSDRHSQSSKL